MDELLAKVKAYDWGQSRAALTELTELIRKAHGNKAELAKIEKGLIAVLGSDAKRAGKQFACRQLSIIGTEASVPALAGMLTGEETSDMARYALERIPGSTVDTALRGALAKAKGKPQIGIVNSIGQRRDKKAVAALSELLGSSDETLAVAAAAALGSIAGSQATKALAAVKGKAKGKLQMCVLDAYLRCADQLVADGKRTQALAIYKELQDKSLPTPIQRAALRGRLSAMKRQR